MSLKIYNVMKVLNCQISLRTALNTHNPRKLKVKMELDSSGQMKSLEMKSKKNRELWDKRNAELLARKGKFCLDDVFFMNEYEAIKYELNDAISKHKDYCLDPSMLNSPHAILKANFVFNMRTKKATKFITKVGGVIILPHEMDFIAKKKIIAFCKTAEDIDLALESGAMEAGDESLVKRLEQGVLNYEQFDQVVCHNDALVMTAKLRPILRERQPVKPSPRVGTDIKSMVHAFVNGYEYESRKLDGIQEEANLSLPIGLISWPLKSLEENFLAFLASIMSNASTQTEGDFLTVCSLTCQPSDEDLELNLTGHIEPLKKTKKSHRSTVRAEPEAESG